jgi:hypothetical protein
LDRRRLLEELVVVVTGRLGVVGVVNSPLVVSVVVRKVVWRAERAVACDWSSIVVQDAPDVAASAWTTIVRARHLHQLRNPRVKKRKRKRKAHWVQLEEGSIRKKKTRLGHGGHISEAENEVRSVATRLLDKRAVLLPSSSRVTDASKLDEILDQGLEK